MTYNGTENWNEYRIQKSKHRHRLKTHSHIQLKNGLSTSIERRSHFDFRSGSNNVKDSKTTQINLRWSLSYCLTAPCDVGSISMYASVSPSRTSGCLLTFLVSADLSFPQSPSAQSAHHLSEHSPLMYLVYPSAKIIPLPQFVFKDQIFASLKMTDEQRISDRG